MSHHTQVPSQISGINSDASMITSMVEPQRLIKEQGIESKQHGHEGQASHTGNVTERYLDLGLNKNYKNTTIQKRWESARSNWLEGQTSQNGKAKEDPRDGIDRAGLPMDHKQRNPANQSVSLRKSIKQIMRSVQSPYNQFENYYPLDEVIDTYMEIWYQSDSDDSSS